MVRLVWLLQYQQFSLDLSHHARLALSIRVFNGQHMVLGPGHECFLVDQRDRLSVCLQGLRRRLALLPGRIIEPALVLQL